MLKLAASKVALVIVLVAPDFFARSVCSLDGCYMMYQHVGLVDSLSWLAGIVWAVLSYVVFA